MIRRKLLAVTMAMSLGAGLGACGSDDSGTTADQNGPGQSTEEDPTLGDEDGGGTDDSAEDADTTSTDDGADEGTPANGSGG